MMSIKRQCSLTTLMVALATQSSAEKDVLWLCFELLVQISYFSAFDDIKVSSSRNNKSVGCLSLAEDLYGQLRLLKKLFASQCNPNCPYSAAAL